MIRTLSLFANSLKVSRVGGDLLYLHVEFINNFSKFC